MSFYCQIWNHPDILHQIIEQRKMEDNDLDIDEKDDVTSAAGSKGKRGRGGGGGGLKKSGSTTSTTSMDSMISRENDHAITYDWVRVSCELSY